MEMESERSKGGAGLVYQDVFCAAVPDVDDAQYVAQS